MSNTWPLIHHVAFQLIAFGVELNAYNLYGTNGHGIHSATSPRAPDTSRVEHDADKLFFGKFTDRLKLLNWAELKNFFLF